MSARVRDAGRLDAPIVVIGEAPGRHEEAHGRPFVGPSGALLGRWWYSVGLTRADCYLTNVWPERPPHNKIEAVPRESLVRAVEELHARLAALADPIVIVPTGNVALRALLRQPLFAQASAKITDWRGSILDTTLNDGRVVKMIPTIHPAAVFREPWYERPCRADWQRIAADRHFRDRRLPAREHFVQPTLADLADFSAQVATADRLAIDIETPGGQIACIAFAVDPAFSITVPTTEAYWRGSAAAAWEVIATWLASPAAKVLQNGLFDTFYLTQDHGLWLRRWRWDTLAMHHALDPGDAHDLAYMASIDTRQPFWKHEAKDPELMARYASNEHALWVYNGIDAAVTLELQAIYEARLRERGLLPFYQRHYYALFHPLLDLMLRGVRVDQTARARRHVELTIQVLREQDTLAELAGERLEAKKDLSRVKIERLLYETLGLPKQRSRKTGATTTDEVTLRRLALRFPAAADLIGHILHHRRLAKLRSVLDDGPVDPDGRLRCQYKFTTETGRLASSKNPRGTGQNLQNVDREVRHTFLPDLDDQVFLECDLSQAEGRIVYALSGDPALIALARKPPWAFDMHTHNACLIFDKPPDQITKAERYLGKKTVHGAQRGLGADKLAGELLKDGIVRSVRECAGYLQRYLDTHPGLQQYFAWVRRLLLRDRRLTNSWGRVWAVAYERMNDDLYRRGYSFLPQSEIGELMNQWGLLALARQIQVARWPVAINLQVHDSLVISTPVEATWRLAQFLRDSLERPRVYHGAGGPVELSIPVEFKVGRSWAGELDIKQLTDETTWDARMREWRDGAGASAA